MTTTRTITADEVIAKAREVLANHPDNINPVISEGQHSGGPTCVYRNEDGTQHCVGGEILFELGVTLPEWGTETNEQGIECSEFGEFLASQGVVLQSYAMRLLSAVQNQADQAYHEGHGEWGFAVSVDKAIEEWAPEYEDE